MENASYHTFIGINPQALHFKTDNLTHTTCGAFKKSRAHTWLASYRIFPQTRSFTCCRQLTMVKVKCHGNTVITEMIIRYIENIQYVPRTFWPFLMVCLCTKKQRDCNSFLPKELLYLENIIISYYFCSNETRRNISKTLLYQ